ncbi:hypothetical protein SELMODRAFT_439738 [Selaginella moellendorffii]|uniref:VOC domain-containing protein n=1 Tax=Selaginella moellendorffii TaxID=88036 RepID=D8R6W4_SELML|nr:uncharacterized protein LOC9634396 [Selaginella moellendorffii]EFJ31787.1 hypothetical protein SELMODRAFT_439738 [Selaginella moellendorffii]|eukprot:XP_002967188.1 uncharacterized protein LOC9634396 [Selaginella moellendorffii]
MAYKKWQSTPLPLASLNHISRNCSNVQESMDFYVNVLGFIPVKRPGALNFEGAWLYNYGIGIHLLQREPGITYTTNKSDQINTRADHISFQCEDIDLVEKKLVEAGSAFVRRVVEEAGIEVEQIFFHDPDGFMIEVCTCEKLPLEPLIGGNMTNIRSCLMPYMRTSAITTIEKF